MAMAITDQRKRCCTCKFFIVVLGIAGMCSVDGNSDCPSANGLDDACQRYEFGEE